jgi:hypothetical protein
MTASSSVLRLIRTCHGTQESLEPYLSLLHASLRRTQALFHAQVVFFQHVVDSCALFAAPTLYFQHFVDSFAKNTGGG